MALLIAIGSLTAGVIIGVVATYRFSNTSPVKVRQLEQQIEDLQQTHKAYRENVSNHFSTTAELVQQMTESYKDVYRHLASGAQTLCDHEVADKMLPAGERDRLFQEDEEKPGEEQPSGDNADSGQPEAPRDYADRESGGGALSEDYGLGKSETTTESATAATADPTPTAQSDSDAEGKNDNAHSSTDWSSTTDTEEKYGKQEEDPLAPYRKPEADDGTADDRADADDDVNADSTDKEQERSQKG